MARRISHNRMQQRQHLNNVIESRVEHIDKMLSGFPLDNKTTMIDSEYAEKFNLPQKRTAQTRLWFDYDMFNRILPADIQLVMNDDLIAVLKDIQFKIKHFNGNENERQSLLISIKNLMKITLDNYHEEEYEEDKRIAYFNVESLDYISIEALQQSMAHDVDETLNQLADIEGDASKGVNYEFLYNLAASFAVFVSLFPYIFNTIKEAQAYIKTKEV